MKKVLKWGIIVLVAIVVIGAFVGEDDDVQVTEGNDSEEVSGETTESDDNSEEQTNEDDDSEEQASEDDNDSDVKTAGIGDTATINDFSFKVNGVEEKEEIHNGNEFTEPATTSGKFVVVDVTVTNDRSEKVTIDSSFFKLIDDSGSEYEPSTSGEVFMNMVDEDDFFLEQVNPGLEKTGKVVFEVGADVDVPNSILEAQTGFWGTEKIEISLN